MTPTGSEMEIIALEYLIHPPINNRIVRLRWRVPLAFRPGHLPHLRLGRRACLASGPAED